MYPNGTFFYVNEYDYELNLKSLGVNRFSELRYSIDEY